jgi:hypothetical protein
MSVEHGFTSFHDLSSEEQEIYFRLLTERLFGAHTYNNSYQEAPQAVRAALDGTIKKGDEERPLREILDAYTALIEQIGTDVKLSFDDLSSDQKPE